MVVRRKKDARAAVPVQRSEVVIILLNYRNSATTSVLRSVNVFAEDFNLTLLGRLQNLHFIRRHVMQNPAWVALSAGYNFHVFSRHIWNTKSIVRLL